MNSQELDENINLLGKKTEREKELFSFTKEESYNYFENKYKFISGDIELIKSYSKNLFPRLKNPPIEIINIIVSPFTKFKQETLDNYNKFLEKIKEIKTNNNKIIKYIYNNGIIHDEPIKLPCESDNIQNNNNLDSNLMVEISNPNFLSLNTWEISKSIKEYKWSGLVKIIILYGDNGFIKQIIKNIDYYHNSYLIINLNKVTKKEKSHFNNIINNIYSFEDLISFLKQDIYEHSIGKNNIKEISDKFKEYNDLLKRYLNYDLNSNNNNNYKDNNYIYIFFQHKNNIVISQEEWALFDSNSSSKSYICQCFTSKIKNNNKNEISNLVNPEIIVNELEVELSISNNIYNIIMDEEDYNINFHINDLTLNKKMVGITRDRVDKNNYNHDFFVNNILLDFSICDYICNLFNIKLFENGIKLNSAEIHFYQSEKFNIPFFIAKEIPRNYKNKYNSELYESFSHFSYCISRGKILIENINEYDGTIFSFDIFKDNYDLNNEDSINIFRFFCYHKCNKFCEMLKLNNVDVNFYDMSIFYQKGNRICDICKIIFNIDKLSNENNKFEICICSECYKKIIESKYERVCVKCGNKFEYYYMLYILQKIETPSVCETCKNKTNEKCDVPEKENSGLEDKIKVDISEDKINN